ncbi:MAG: zinc-ribbon domain-containing protein [Caulobacteraceae bacterium]|nr:zinc-ribbon domain-containing protein [Caulobacteraceae bacterium]
MGAEIGDLEEEDAEASDSPAMILTCPECATRYFIDDAKLGSAGRTVRCAHCGARWTAAAEAPIELAQSPEEGALAAEPATTELEPPPQDLPRAFRARAETRKREREAAASGVIWAATAAVLAVVIAAAVLFRVDVVAMWPRSAGAYAAVGLPVNPVGLTFEGLRAQPALRDGHAALVISGAIRNIEGRPIAAPPVRIDVLDKDGRIAAGKIADPKAARIPPGEMRHFSVVLFDPPVSTEGVNVTFVMTNKPGPAAAPPSAKVRLRDLDAEAHAAPPGTSPPAPPPPPAAAAAPPPRPAAQAQPLPADSPYALPQSAETRPHG